MEWVVATSRAQQICDNGRREPTLIVNQGEFVVTLSNESSINIGLDLQPGVAYRCAGNVNLWVVANAGDSLVVLDRTNGEFYPAYPKVEAPLPPVPLWESYTPGLFASVADPVLGAGGAALGRYIITDGTCYGWFVFRFGGAGLSAGNGQYYVGLPVTRIATDASQTIGAGLVNDASAVAGRRSIILTPGVPDTSRVSLLFTGGSVNQGTIVWALNDTISGQFEFEVDA